MVGGPTGTRVVPGDVDDKGDGRHDKGHGAGYSVDEKCPKRQT